MRIKQVSQFDQVAQKPIGRNHEKAWPSGVVLNIMQIQTITAGCQCKQELESSSLMQAMFKLHARYLDNDIRLANHLLIRMIAEIYIPQAFRARRLRSLNFHLTGTVTLLILTCHFANRSVRQGSSPTYSIKSTCQCSG